ncbi:MAG: hypothetical protein WD739_06545 [Actinomycetota bacterium]
MFTAIFAIVATLILQTIASTASAGPNERGFEGGSDLQVTLDDAPDPVSAEAHVLLEAKVFNSGPGDAFGVSVELTHDDLFEFVDATFDYEFGGGDRIARGGKGEFCFPDDGGDPVVQCNVGFLGAGDTLTVGFIMLVDDVSEETEASSSVEAFPIESFDPDTENNSDSEDTTIEPKSDMEAFGFIPPGGGTLTTDSGEGATPDDPLFLTMRVPSGGPGGPANVNEETCGGDNSEFTLCLGGLLGNFVPPGDPGDYDRIVADLVYDHSIVAGGLRPMRKPWTVFHQKVADGPVIQLEKCVDTENVAPCIKNFKRLGEVPTRDLRVRVIIDSDPRLATRK